MKKYESIIIGTQEKMNRDIAQASKSLETIGTLSKGVDHIDVGAFEENNVEVCSVGKTNTISVAEHTLSLILGLQKRLMESNESVLEGKGREGLDKRPIELYQKTVGIIGAGSIAKEVISKLEPFDVEIKIWTFNPEKNAELTSKRIEFSDTIQELIDQSNVVSIHIPLTDKTENLISSENLKKVKKDRKRILVNTSRAEILGDNIIEEIGEKSVFDAAGLDVFNQELPEELRSERTIFTPHTAGLTQESTRRMRNELVEKLSKNN